MLPLRLAIVTVIAGICLWGLFSLLGTLKEPALLRSAKATAVKGCDNPDSADAMERCSALFCEKALIDRALVDRRTRFEITLDRHDPRQRLIAGNALTDAGKGKPFACLLEGRHVVAARLLDAGELRSLAAQEGGWSL